MARTDTDSGKKPLSAEDLALLERIQSGAPEAFDAFVERFGPMIYAFGLRMCGHREDAEDVFQETLVKVFTQLKSLDNPNALRTWLWRVVANECRMSRRGPRDPARRVGLGELTPGRDDEGGPPPEPRDDASPSPEERAITSERHALVEAALRNLSPDYRIIILLRDFEGLSTDEVATVLGITTANAKVRLHRARLALRRELHGDPSDPASDEARERRGS